MNIPALTNRFILLILFLLAAAVGIYFMMTRIVDDRKLTLASSQLEEIYNALEQYELRNGSLPVLALYPADPVSGRDSLRYELIRYVINPGVFVSPVGHHIVRDSGLTYLWNPTFNGQRLSGDEDWLLIDIQALEPKNGPAHRKGYLTLFSSGKVTLLSDPPESLLTFAK